MQDFFDDGFEQETSLKSFFNVKTKKDKLEWLNIVKDKLLDESKQRTESQREKLLAYMGKDQYHYTKDSRQLNDPEFRKRRRVKKFIIPHINDIIETKISQMTRLKTDINVLPTHDEYSDRGAAKVSKLVIRNIFERQHLDEKMTEVQRHTRIFGESYVKICYNNDIGDLDPDYVEAKNMGIKMDSIKRLGDVELKQYLPWRVLLQRKDNIDDVDYYFCYDIVEKDKVEAEYSNLKITEEETGVTFFDTSDLQERHLEDHVLVWEFYHKKTKFLPNGAHIKFTSNNILEDNEYPYSMDCLNIERLTDVDVPGYLNGVSKLEYALPMQKRYDDLSTLIAKNIYLLAHPKWMLPKGAAKMEHLGNDNTIVQYSGPVPPGVVQVQPNPGEVYSFRENIKNELQVILGSHGISRGEIPKGITASSALQFLNELESERASSEIAKHGNFIRSIAKKVLSVAGDYYKPDDGRLLRVVGRDNAANIRHFDTAVLSKEYDVKFENSSGFPETMAAKKQRALEVMQYNPNVLDPERWVSVLEFGEMDRLVSITTNATDSAESEMEDILAGNLDVPEPEIYEDLVAKLKVYYYKIQARPFKEESSNEIYARVMRQIYVAEKLVLQKAKYSPIVSAQLANIKLFPVSSSLYQEAQQVVMSMGQRQAEVQGAANRGEPTDSSIPGEEDDTIKR